MNDMIGWYSLDMKLDMVEHPPVALPEALEIARKYYANADKKYESGEQGMVETFFGFSRSKETFIELCVNGADLVSFKFETVIPAPPGMPWYRKIFYNSFTRHELKLRSWDEMEAKITEFFTQGTG